MNTEGFRLRLAASIDSYKGNSTFYLRRMVDSWHDPMELEHEEGWCVQPASVPI